MLKLDSPLQLAPVFKPKIWGRRDLAPLYPDFWTTWRGEKVGIHYPQREGSRSEPIGEVWLTGDNSVFVNGPLAGTTLGEACARYCEELCGCHACGQRFPLLAKFLFTSDWLSVQVHPDDHYARTREPGSTGKCEMWYVLEAERGAEFLLGVKRGVTSAQFGAALDGGTSSEMLRRFRPQSGEAVFVPPGTIHALGPGIILLEVEQNSDVTYRLDDFGRKGPGGEKRPLHRENGLQVARFELPPLRGLPRFEFPEDYGARRLVLACPHFAVEELTLREIISAAGTGRVEAFAVLSGDGRVETQAGWYAYRVGHVWLVPPGSASYRLVPEIESHIVKFYVPNLDEDFRKPLAARGVPRADTNKVIFV
ncbi:MAG: type I phosphomannose isomerase catalytic subunit [Terriglobia bacterium]